MAERARAGVGTSTTYPFTGAENTTTSSPFVNLSKNINKDGNIGYEGDNDGDGEGRSMPLTWILESLLDEKALPLSFLRTIADQIPDIKEAHCSRLLLKLALRYLEEAVEYGDVDVDDIALVRFVVQEGRNASPDLRTIHSLKQSFENDLILRVQTEAVLRHLRRGSDEIGEGNTGFEAFEDAIEKAFPEDLCEERGAERRNELIALLPDQREGPEGPNGDRDRVLKKYPLDELLRDIAKVVEDKKKSFKVKFLDQVASDFLDGVYVPSPRLDADLPGIWTAAGVHEECASDLKGGDAAVAGFSRSNGTAVQYPERDPHCEVDPGTGVAQDLTDSVLNMKHAATSPEDVPMVSKEVRANFMEAKAAEHVEPMADISEVIFDFGFDSSALSKDLNEVVKSAGRCAATLQNNSSCIPVFNDNPINQPKAGAVRPSSGGGAASTMQEDRAAATSSQGAGMKRGPHDSGDTFNSIPKKSKFGVSQGEHEGLKEQEHSNPSARSRAVQNEGLQFHSSASTKDGGADESQKEVQNGTAAVNENDKTIDNREGGTRRTRVYLSRLSKDGVVSPVKAGANLPDLRQEKIGRDCELQGSCHRATSDELGAQMTGGGIQAFCHRCLMGAHECCLLDLSMTRAAGFEGRRFCFNCASKTALEVIKKSDDDVKVAEKLVTVAEDAVKVARKAREKKIREVAITKERLSSFWKGAIDWSFEHSQAHESSYEHEGRTQVDSCKRRTEVTSQVGPVEKDAPVDFAFDSGRRDRQVSRGNAPITVAENRIDGKGPENVIEPDLTRQPSSEREKSTSLPPSVAPTGNLAAGRVTKSRISGGALENIVESYPVSQPSPQRGKSTSCPPPVAPMEDLAAGRVTESSISGTALENLMKSYPMSQPSPQWESGTSPSHSVAPTEHLACGGEDSAKASLSSQVLAEKEGSSAVDAAAVNGMPPVGDEQKIESGERRNLESLDRMTERIVPLVSGSDRQDGISTGVRQTNRITSRASTSTLHRGESSAAHVQHDDTVNIAGDEGDGHDGDLEEVHETTRIDADGAGRAEEADDQMHDQTFKASSNIEAKPSRGLGRVYRGRTPIAGLRRKILPWTDIEEAALKEGVKLYSNDGGWGFRWKLILEYGLALGKFHSTRTTVDLKDKWRNLKKAEANVS